MPLWGKSSKRPATFYLVGLKDFWAGNCAEPARILCSPCLSNRNLCTKLSSALPKSQGDFWTMEKKFVSTKSTTIFSVWKLRIKSLPRCRVDYKNSHMVACSSAAEFPRALTIDLLLSDPMPQCKLRPTAPTSQCHMPCPPPTHYFFPFLIMSTPTLGRVSYSLLRKPKLQ